MRKLTLLSLFTMLLGLSSGANAIGFKSPYKSCLCDISNYRNMGGIGTFEFRYAVNALAEAKDGTLHNTTVSKGAIAYGHVPGDEIQLQLIGAESKCQENLEILVNRGVCPE
jgi:hypothetical protein